MRCYFNLVGAHQSIVDGKGVEVTDLEETRALVLEVAAEMVQDGEATIADWQGWRLEAVDASGAVLLIVRFGELLH